MRRGLMLGTAVLVLATACSANNGRATSGSAGSSGGASGKATAAKNLPSSCAQSPLPVIEGARDCESSNGMTAYTITFDVPTVSTFYVDYFKSNGWDREDDAKQQEVGTWGKDRQKGTMVLTADGQRTKVNIALISFAN